MDTEAGEFQETRLQHREPAEQFYRELAVRGVRVRLGMESRGCSPTLIDLSWPEPVEYEFAALGHRHTGKIE